MEPSMEPTHRQNEIHSNVDKYIGDDDNFLGKILMSHTDGLPGHFYHFYV